MPRPVSRFLILLTVTLITVQLTAPCLASDGDDDASLRITISQLADSEGSVRSAAIKNLSASKDTRILPVLEHYQESSLFLWKDQLILCPKMTEDEDEKIKSMIPLYYKTEEEIGSHKMEKGETMTLRYRVLVHAGDEKAGKIAERFAAYAEVKKK